MPIRPSSQDENWLTTVQSTLVAELIHTQRRHITTPASHLTTITSVVNDSAAAIRQYRGELPHVGPDIC